MAQQQIITKPYVVELQDNDSLFINHDGALRQIKKGDADFASGADMRAEVAAREAFEAQEVAAREAFEKSETEARGQFETSVGEQIAEKANVDGYYEEMTVGDAEQLVATQSVEDNEPYLFRSTGGSSDVGNRAYFDKIVGGTVAWNQLVKNGDFSDGKTHWGGDSASLEVADGVVAVTVLALTYSQGLYQGGIPVSNGHKYLLSADFNFPYSNVTVSYRVGLVMGAWSGQSGTANTWCTLSTIRSATADSASEAFELDVHAGTQFSVNDVYYVRNCYAIDLTQMFGSTIADYIYSLEQSQAGAGVAWFKKLFPNDYYAYNAGELLSVEGLQSHDAVGFNQFDIATNKAKLLGGYQYEIVGAYTSVSYEDASGNTETLTITNRLFTPTNNGTLTVVGADSTTCVHLVWSGYRNGEYEPYEKHSYPLDSSLTLRGIPKLDASNNLYYDGDEYTSDGKVKRKYGIVDLGTIDWVQGGGGNKASWVPVSWRTNVKPVQNIKDKANILCSKYKTDVAAHVEKQVNDKTICVNDSAWVYIYDSAYVSVTPQAFKEAMSGVMLVYELATPTTETAEPFQFTQIIDDFGTEEFVSNGFIPAGHATRYPANLRDKLQHLPDLASTDGTYLIQQSDKQMTLVHMPAIFPEIPTEDGTYTLKTVVTGGVATLQWVVE